MENLEFSDIINQCSSEATREKPTEVKKHLLSVLEKSNTILSVPQDVIGLHATSLYGLGDLIQSGSFRGLFDHQEFNPAATYGPQRYKDGESIELDATHGVVRRLEKL